MALGCLGFFPGPGHSWLHPAGSQQGGNLLAMAATYWQGALLLHSFESSLILQPRLQGSALVSFLSSPGDAESLQSQGKTAKACSVLALLGAPEPPGAGLSPAGQTAVDKHLALRPFPGWQH